MPRSAPASPRWVGGRAKRALLGAGLSGTLLVTSSASHADRLTIDRPGRHPDYVFEVEPHLNVGLIDPPGIGSGKGIGAGFRGTVELVDNGFVSTINNTVGLSFGLDYVRHGIDRGDRTCARTEPDPLDPADSICVEFDQGDNADYFVLPVVMQWNFWLSEEWSVFGEPGLALYLIDDGGDNSTVHLDGAFYLGGRWRFADRMTLTMRAGYPSFSVGVSFLL